MANTVKLKRSATPSAVPTTAQLDLGEVAINTYDGKMYIKKDDGTASVVEVGASSGGGGSVYYKDPVRVATTANGALATAFANGQNLDGLTLATGDRILIKNQTTASENGIYVVNASGAPTRASDMDADSEAQRGCIVYVQYGNTNGGSNFQLTSANTNPVVIGSTNLYWMPLQGIATYGVNSWTAPVASSSGSIAIGSNASSTATVSVAIGANTSSKATQSIAIGNTVTSSGSSSIAIGSDISAGSSSGAQLSIGTNIAQGTGAAGSTVIGSYTAGSGQITNCTIISPIGRSVTNAVSNIWLHHCTLIGGYTGVLSSSTTLSTALGESALAEMHAEIAFGVGIFGNRADKKISFIGAHTTTTNATATEIGTATPNNLASTAPTGRIVLTNDSTYLFDCDIVARNTTTDTQSKVWNVKFGIRRGTSAANTALIGTPTYTVFGQDTGTENWGITVTADTANGRPNISVTGEASKTIRWVANIRMTKVSG